MTARVQDWLKQVGGRPLHVNNGLRGLIGVELRGMAFITPYGPDLSAEIALSDAIRNAKLWHANQPPARDCTL